jgi:hypothetical protein
MYRAWIEEIPGFQLRGDQLISDPVIPHSWLDFKLRYRHGEAIYDIEGENSDDVGRGVAWVELNGRRLENLVIPLESGAIKHKVRVRMGDNEISSSPDVILSPSTSLGASLLAPLRINSAERSAQRSRRTTPGPTTSVGAGAKRPLGLRPALSVAQSKDQEGRNIAADHISGALIERCDGFDCRNELREADR